MNDLVSLTDILDTISQLEQPVSSNEDDTFTVEEQADVIGTVLQMMYDYVIENPTHIQNTTFHEDMMESVEQLIQHSTFDADATDDVVHDTVADAMICLVDCAIDMFYLQIMPKRSTLMSESKTSKMSIHKRTHTRHVIANLQLKPQPAQRSNEWYAYRHALITASNAYKIFETPGAQNQLIYEKCAPLVVHVESVEIQDNKDQVQTTLQTFYINNHDDSNSHLVPTVNVTSPMHWGQKYEPLSTMYYEMIYGTTVGEYGCIQHDIYKFIGASPDGIVDDVNNDKYGQMLEIKNIVNREITGIPAKAYWVQMQLQMEVCDLDECDFLETRFKEYADREEFNKDCAIAATATTTVAASNKTRDGKWKGALMYFIDAAGVPSYEYKPLTMEMREFDTEWAPARRREHAQQGHRFMWSSYWWLEEVSCVLVERNKLWFSLVIKEMSAFWDIILKERKTGYAHRAPAKRKVKDDGLFEQCLIMIPGLTKSNNDEDKSITPTHTPTSDDSSHPKNVVHIRTQSFDDTVQNNNMF